MPWKNTDSHKRNWLSFQDGATLRTLCLAPGETAEKVLHWVDGKLVELDKTFVDPFLKWVEPKVKPAAKPKSPRGATKGRRNGATTDPQPAPEVGDPQEAPDAH